MKLHRIIRNAVLCLAFAAVAAPVAAARPDIGPPPVVHADLSGFYRPIATHAAIPTTACGTATAGTRSTGTTAPRVP
jgi:hypothetical protein